MPRDARSRRASRGRPRRPRRALLSMPAQQPELPTLGAEPREPSSRRLEVAAHAARRENGEREQQRGALAADEEKASPCGVRRALDAARSSSTGASTANDDERSAELDARALGSRDERVDVPQARLARARSARPTRSVRYVRASGAARRERGTSLRDDERRRVAAGGSSLVAPSVGREPSASAVAASLERRKSP